MYTLFLTFVSSSCQHPHVICHVYEIALKTALESYLDNFQYFKDRVPSFTGGGVK